MITYPVSFTASAEAQPGIQSVWKSTSQSHQLSCAIPPDFEGPGGALSPEDLFAQALTNCFLATFKVYAEKSRAIYSTVIVHSELIVDLDESRKPVMKKLILKAEIGGCENADRVRALAQRAFSSGFILNSVKTELQFELHVG